MFGHFYHSIIRKSVVAFGSLFNNLTLVRYTSDGATEIERIKVPLVYAQRSNWLPRLQADADLTKSIQTALPRMSFEITSIAYDPTRKLNTLIRHGNMSSGQLKTQYMGAPYDIFFDLNIYAKSISDAAQIVEQILPYFQPTYSVNMVMASDIGLNYDVPVSIQNVQSTIEYEGQMPDTVRLVYFTLSFNMKTLFPGPIANTTIIRESITNFYDDSAKKTSGYLTFNLGSGSGSFKIGDLVFQGNSKFEAHGVAEVIDWNSAAGRLKVRNVQGEFYTNTNVHALSTNGVFSLSNFDLTTKKVSTITIVPDPLTANGDSDFGFSTTIVDYPSA